MLSDEDMRARMLNGWRGGLPEHHGRLDDQTVCGVSSLIRNTVAVRAWLPGMVERHNIVTVCDAGAGDLHWIRYVPWNVDYMAFDLIPRHPSVRSFDITAYPLPDCDLILCRAVLNHLDETRTLMALAHFRKAAQYLVATQFDDSTGPQSFVRYDLRGPPFNLGEPLEAVMDTCAPGCTLALWRL